jgi:heptosyltransferase-2
MKKVLVLNIGGIGDMVMATPALAALAPHVEGGSLDLLTVGRSAPVVEKAPFIGGIATIDVSALTGRLTAGGILGLIRSLLTLVRLRLRRYELALDLMAMESPRAAARRRTIIGLISPRRSAGRDTNGWGGWLDVRAAERLESRVHEVVRKLSVLRALGMNEAAPEMTVYSTDEDKRAADALMRRLARAGTSGVAVLIPGAWRPTRRWDPGRFIETGRCLADRYRCAVAVCGAREEKKTITAVSKGIPGSFALIDVPPRVLFEMFRRCVIMVTNDTGPMHLAAAAGLPRIVAIFGPENPSRYAPVAKGSSVIVVSQHVDCSPCTRYRCDDMKCLAPIGTDRVKEAIDLLMADTGPGAPVRAKRRGGRPRP